jgi:hypothetical protein
VAISPTGFGLENDCAGENQQLLYARDPPFRQRGCYIRAITASVQLENKITSRDSQ